ncbi:MAG TPA: hypothetical protein VLW53_19485 [Candidatus Eisenbacteria bacterium]|nr:hypothetical protein [Candidatus Eisenbacteria bacterium]
MNLSGLSPAHAAARTHIADLHREADAARLARSAVAARSSRRNRPARSVRSTRSGWLRALRASAASRRRSHAGTDTPAGPVACCA